LFELGLAELAGSHQVGSRARIDNSEEHMKLEQDDTATKMVDDLLAQNDHLQEQCTQLQRLQKASFDQVREKKRSITEIVEEQRYLAETAKAEHG
jgi:hypothetical protein